MEFSVIYQVHTVEKKRWKNVLYFSKIMRLCPIQKQLESSQNPDCAGRDLYMLGSFC